MDRSTKWLIAGFGGFVLASMLITGVANYLLAGDERVLVVAVKPGAGQPARDLLKRDCGSLPGIRVVADRGDPDPAVQGRFPVRFDISGSTVQQEAALQACVYRHPGIVGGLSVER